MKTGAGKALIITSYDVVHVILKNEAADWEAYRSVLKYDRRRARYYFSGKVIDYPGHNDLTIVIVPEQYSEAYRKARKIADKYAFLIFIHLGHIEYILLPFNALDWIG